MKLNFIAKAGNKIIIPQTFLTQLELFHNLTRLISRSKYVRTYNSIWHEPKDKRPVLK